MTLFCAQCNKVHTFTPLETEALVYGLLAMYVDEQNDPSRDGSEEYEAPCLVDILGNSQDQEGYGEQTKLTIARRMAFEIEDHSINVEYGGFANDSRAAQLREPNEPHNGIMGPEAEPTAPDEVEGGDQTDGAQD